MTITNNSSDEYENKAWKTLLFVSHHTQSALTSRLF